MNMNSIVKGVSIGLTAGAIGYAFVNASSRDKRKLKSNAGKALHAIGDMVEGINYMMK